MTTLAVLLRLPGSGPEDRLFGAWNLEHCGGGVVLLGHWRGVLLAALVFQAHD